MRNEKQNFRNTSLATAGGNRITRFDWYARCSNFSRNLNVSYYTSQWTVNKTLNITVLFRLSLVTESILRTYLPYFNIYLICYTLFSSKFKKKTVPSILRVVLHLRPTCFTPIYFNAPCKFTPLLDLRSLIFGLTPFGWLRSATLPPCLRWEYHF